MRDPALAPGAPLDELNEAVAAPSSGITGGGTGVANHSGTRLLADLGDAVGLTARLSVAMAPTKQSCRGHDRGEVLADLIVAIAGGGVASNGAAHPRCP
jgi:hypothetical protein